MRIRKVLDISVQIADSDKSDGQRNARNVALFLRSGIITENHSKGNSDAKRGTLGTDVPRCVRSRVQ